MANDVQLNGVSVGGGSKARALERTTNVYTQYIGTDRTPGGLVETVLGTPATLRVSYTAAQTNVTVKAPASGKRLALMRIAAKLSPDCPGNIAIKVGFHASVTPTGADCVFSNPGLAPGQPDRDGNGEGILGIGAADVPLLITCDDPRGGGAVGSLEINITTCDAT